MGRINRTKILNNSRIVLVKVPNRLYCEIKKYGLDKVDSYVPILIKEYLDNQKKEGKI